MATNAVTGLARMVQHPPAAYLREIRGSGKLAVLAILLILTGCSARDRLALIEEAGVLRLGIHTSPVSAHPEVYRLEYQLAYRFAEELGVTLEAYSDDSKPGLLRNLRLGRLDLAAVTRGSHPDRRFPHSRPYHKVDGSGRQLVWLFAPGAAQGHLRQRADKFLRHLEQSGQLALLREQQFADFAPLDPENFQTFSRNMRRDLPCYEAEIRQVAGEYQLDWRLLAAMAYQESHWNPRARSNTGVRGMMMLTRDTAREMAVDDRLDPMQSLRGGAGYLLKVKNLLPGDIVEPDRSWFALAAYNIGRGHLEDARVITERLGGDPHYWTEVATYLPLLQERSHYADTRHGYARGSEPVTYVNNIRNYYRILSWWDLARNSTEPTGSFAALSPEASHFTSLLDSH